MNTTETPEWAGPTRLYGPSHLETVPRKNLPPQIAATLPPELLSPEDELVRGVDEPLRSAASPVNHVTSDAPPFLLVHGTVDGVVPYAQSERLAAALTAAGATVQLVPVEGADHIFDGHADIDAIVQLSVAYLATHSWCAGPPRPSPDPSGTGMPGVSRREGQVSA
jgi:acetyl esterase/lipase